MGKRDDIKQLPPLERLNALFSYDKTSGNLRWKSLPPNFRRAKVGDIAGTIGASGYRVIGIGGVYYYAHRIIWKMMTGNEPQDQIDHIDTNRLNNRWLNLRPTANGRNIQNSKIRKDNISGVKGVSWDASHNKWRAVITANGKSVRLGRFDTVEQAANVITQARMKFHGEFARMA